MLFGSLTCCVHNLRNKENSTEQRSHAVGRRGDGSDGAGVVVVLGRGGAPLGGVAGAGSGAAPAAAAGVPNRLLPGTNRHKHCLLPLEGPEIPGTQKFLIGLLIELISKASTKSGGQPS